MIIKAGTYRFNDELDLNLNPETFGLEMPFTLPNFNHNEYVYSVVGKGIGLVEGDSVILTMVGNLDNNQGLITEQYIAVYTDEYGWNTANTSNHLYPIGYGQIFTVTTDTEVDNTAGTWFTENTQMLIKAGTYRWNDVVDITASYQVEIPITLPNFTYENTEFSCSAIGVAVYHDIRILGYGVNISDGIDSQFADIGVYNQNQNEWSVMYDGSITFPEKYGQIITVTADQYVPTNFGLWATSNWQPYTEPTPTENITITITYKGSPIITITNGVMLNLSGEPTNIAIIPTEDYKLDSNIELTITKS